jgi:hypothetical protein
MSDRRMAAVLLGSGGFCTAVGVWVGFVGTFSIGLGLVGIGACCVAAGVVLATEPGEDEDWRDELDRWERKWGSRWLPRCPVHGEQLCYTRSDRCPGARDRVE